MAEPSTPVRPEPVEGPELPLTPVADSRLHRCAGCGEGLSTTGVTFWLVSASRAILDLAAIRRRAGLAMAIGNAAIANAFNDEPAAQVFDQPPERCVCETCACTMPLAALVQELLDQAGWRVRRINNTASYNPGDLECAPMLVKTVNAKGRHPVQFALNTLRAAYPDVPVRPSATLLKALFELFDYVGDGEGDLTTVGIVTALAKHLPDEWVIAGHMMRERNPHLSHIDAVAAAMRAVTQGRPLPKAPAPGAAAPKPRPTVTVTHQPPAQAATLPPPRAAPVKAPPEDGPVFGTSGKGWCDQCDQLRTRDQAKACTDPFCKMRPGAKPN